MAVSRTATARSVRRPVPSSGSRSQLTSALTLSSSSFGPADSPSKHDLAFVPARHKGKDVRVKPTEVFGNADSALLGFPTLAPAYAAEETRFGIRRDPPAGQLVAALVSNPPQTLAEASKVFAYLSSQVSSFSTAELDALRWAAIVPVRRPDLKVDVVPPLNLYFSTSDTVLPPGLKGLFSTVPDFGPAAKPFLVACGVKESPSTAEITTMLISDPSRFYDLAGSAERYLSGAHGPPRRLPLTLAAAPNSSSPQFFASSPSTTGPCRQPCAAA